MVDITRLWSLIPWNEPQKAPEEFIEKFPDKHPALLEVFWNRNYTSKEAMDSIVEKDYEYFSDPFALKDMDIVVDKLTQLIESQDKVIVFGDYDADGVTASVTAQIGFEKFGLNVDRYIPSRKEGYGITNRGVDRVVEKFGPDIKYIFTVDNGIKGKDPIRYALDKYGIQVIVTDHHTVDPDYLPDCAVAVINPQQIDCAYPHAHICGCAVVYKVLQALGLKLHGNTDIAESCIDLVAIGTTADMMPFDNPENRDIVRKGLRKMNEDFDNLRPGLRILVKEADYLEPGELDVQSIGFTIAPAINASSRMDHPKYAARLLITDDDDEAFMWASRLLELNDSRKTMQREYSSRIKKELDYGADDMPPLLLHTVPDCPHGIIGLVAADLMRLCYRPVILLTQHNDDNWTGSCRSINGFDISAALRKADKYLNSHGGHSAAAGLSVSDENLPLFREHIENVAKTMLSNAYEISPRIADISLSLLDVNEMLVEVFETLEPCGSIGFTKPSVLFNNVDLSEYRTMGSDGQHLTLTISDSMGNTMRCVGWYMGDWADAWDTEGAPEAIDVTGKLSISNYRGRHVELVIDLMRPHQWQQPSHLPAPPLPGSKRSNQLSDKTTDNGDNGDERFPLMSYRIISPESSNSIGLPEKRQLDVFENRVSSVQPEFRPINSRKENRENDTEPYHRVFKNSAVVSPKKPAKDAFKNTKRKDRRLR